MSPRRPIDQEQLIFHSEIGNVEETSNLPGQKNSLGAGPLKHSVPVFLFSNLHLLRQVRLGIPLCPITDGPNIHAENVSSYMSRLPKQLETALEERRET